MPFPITVSHGPLFQGGVGWDPPLFFFFFARLPSPKKTNIAVHFIVLYCSMSRKRPYDLVKIETPGFISGVISSTEESQRFRFFRFGLRLRRLWSSENKVVGVGSRSGRTCQSQSPESNIVVGLFFRFCLRLQQCSFYLIISDGVISRISVLLPTPSVWFSLDRIALRLWLRLRR